MSLTAVIQWMTLRGFEVTPCNCPSRVMLIETLRSPPITSLSLMDNFEVTKKELVAYNRGIWFEGSKFWVAPRAHAGDLIHEAGHVAIVPEPWRSQITYDVDACLEKLILAADPDTAATLTMAKNDSAVIAWAHLALIDMGIDPEIQLEVGFSDEGRESNRRSLGRGTHRGYRSLGAMGLAEPRWYHPDGESQEWRAIEWLRTRGGL